MVPTQHHLHHHAQALLLSIASSTDNFLVGLSLGLSLSKNANDSTGLPLNILWGVAICNSAGCWLATALGGTLVDTVVIFLEQEESEANPASSSNRHVILALPHAMAAAAFGYLAYQEYNQQQQHEEGSQSDASKQKQTNGSKHHFPSLVSLALPMTLNNLAGGLTGGVALQEIRPLTHAAYALVVSVVTMWAGFHLGQCQTTNVTTERTGYWNSLAQQLSVALYLLLSAQSLYEAVTMEQQNNDDR